MTEEGRITSPSDRQDKNARWKAQKEPSKKTGRKKASPRENKRDLKTNFARFCETMSNYSEAQKEGRKRKNNSVGKEFALRG